MKSIELFAGAGGLALGLELAGFQHLGLVEYDISAANTLKLNRPQWRVVCEDIALTCQKDLEKEFNIKAGDLDLLSGGAPCQSFSYAGKRLGLQDIRGTMFYHYATFLQRLQPKMFLFENVRGLLTHDKGKTYKTICDIFEEQGYNIQYKILNAWDYGVPQKRERLITIGIRKDFEGKCSFSFPEKHTYKPIVKDIVLDKNPTKENCARYSAYKERVFSLVPPGGYWRDIDPNVAKEYMKTCWYMGGGRTGILRRIGLDEPSLTVLTNPGMKQTDRCHPLEVRPFSYRENARLQTFPDEWGFYGKLSEKYKQVGNAVPVNLAKAIGLQIRKTLEEINMCFSSKKTYDYLLSDFISESDFELNVMNTIKKYGDVLKSINLCKFNSNVIDPIKLTFDQKVFDVSLEEIIKMEINRQRDKSNTNAIGYFHQFMFRYIANCIVPPTGFDVVYTNPCSNQKLYVELKNKHNTMNDAAQKDTCLKLQNQLLADPNCIGCYLVEVIAPVSRDIVWVKKLRSGVIVSNPKIRRVSIDRLYSIVTGKQDAFMLICKQIPMTIEKLLQENKIPTVEGDTVLSELRAKNPDILKSLYLLAFETYHDFDKF